MQQEVKKHQQCGSVSMQPPDTFQERFDYVKRELNAETEELIAKFNLTANNMPALQRRNTKEQTSAGKYVHIYTEWVPQSFGDFEEAFDDEDDDDDNDEDSDQENVQDDQEEFRDSNNYDQNNSFNGKLNNSNGKANRSANEGDNSSNDSQSVDSDNDSLTKTVPKPKNVRFSTQRKTTYKSISNLHKDSVQIETRSSDGNKENESSALAAAQLPAGGQLSLTRSQSKISIDAHLYAAGSSDSDGSKSGARTATKKPIVEQRRKTRVPMFACECLPHHSLDAPFKVQPAGTEKFRVQMRTKFGYVPGILTVSENVVMFDPDLDAFEQQTACNPDQKDTVRKCESYIDMDDVFAVRVRREATSQSVEDEETGVLTPLHEVCLDVFLEESFSLRAPIKDDHDNLYCLRVEFKSTDKYTPNGGNDERFGANAKGLTYVHYIAQKIQFNLGKHGELRGDYTSISQVHEYDLITIKSLSERSAMPPKSMRIFKEQVQLPAMSARSRILSDAQVCDIVEQLPRVYRENAWHLLFEPLTHGYSFQTLLTRSSALSAHVIVVQDHEDNVFGAFLTHGWHTQNKIFGSGESFLFTYAKFNTLRTFPWSQKASSFQMFNDCGLFIGVGDVHQTGLFIDKDFAAGSTGQSETYANAPLTKKTQFRIKNIEFWSVDQEAEVEIKFLESKRSILSLSATKY